MHVTPRHTREWPLVNACLRKLVHSCWPCHVFLGICALFLLHVSGLIAVSDVFSKTILEGSRTDRKTYSVFREARDQSGAVLIVTCGVNS